MPVTKICTLLSQRAKNPERVLTVIRAVPIRAVPMMDHHEDPDDVSDNRRERTYDEEDPWVPVKDPSGRRTSFYNRNSGVVALEQAKGERNQEGQELSENQLLSDSSMT